MDNKIFILAEERLLRLERSQSSLRGWRNVITTILILLTLGVVGVWRDSKDIGSSFVSVETNVKVFEEKFDKQTAAIDRLIALSVAEHNQMESIGQRLDKLFSRMESLAPYPGNRNRQ